VFVLDKWYLDLVTADGAAFIGYSACLRWFGLRFQYQSSLFSPPDGPAEEHTSLRKRAPPARVDDAIEWRSPAIATAGTWRRVVPGLRRRLLHGGCGRILWLCHQPRALARVTLPGGRELQGDGYVEQLRMTLGPAGLPFNTLHWGRFHGDRETLVWIAWQHGNAGRWIFRNGVSQLEAVVSDRGVDGLGDGASLRFAGLRPVRERRVPPVFSMLPGLRHGTAGMITTLHERKWIGRGVLRRPRGDNVSGWFIHEEVTWRGEAA
jgi:hypothetical protein